MRNLIIALVLALGISSSAYATDKNQSILGALPLVAVFEDDKKAIATYAACVLGNTHFLKDNNPLVNQAVQFTCLLAADKLE